MFLVAESDRRPGLFLGTSSDRIGSPKGEQAWFATATKYLETTRTSFYSSLNWSGWDEGLNFPFGVAQDVGDGFAVRYMYDGQESHALLDYYRGDAGVSLIWVWLERFGVAFHGGF